MKSADPVDVASMCMLSILWLERVMELDYEERQKYHKSTVVQVLDEMMRTLKRYQERTKKEIELRW